MSLTRTCISLLLLFLTLATAQSSFQKQYYVDSDSTASETGEIDGPFHSLTSVFAAIEKDITGAESTQAVEITISCKESSSVVISDSVELSLDGLNRPSSVLKLNTYSSDTSKQTPERATLQFSGPAAHLKLSLQKIKLVVQDFHFRTEITETLNNAELILIEVPSEEATFVKCDFSDIEVDFQDSNKPVINLSGGRYLVKHCLLSDLTLANPLFQAKDTANSRIKFEFNDVRSITTTNSALVKASGLSSFDFVENKIQDTNGRLVQVDTAKYVIFSNNTFSEVKGQTPIDFNSVNRIILGDNSFTYDNLNSEGRDGLLSCTNFGFLFVTSNTLKGYSGSVSPIKASIDESSDLKTGPMVKIAGSSFTGNALIVKDAESVGLALLSLKLGNKAHISVQETVFDGNSITDRREDTSEALNAVSTIYIDAQDSQLQIHKTRFLSNKASRSLRNSYVNAKEITVDESEFSSNGQIKTGDSSQGTFRSFLWFGEDITFTEDEFKENYADQGGAIGIYQGDGGRVPNHVLIQTCNFVQNEAKNGGAIFTDISSDKLEIQLKDDNTFTDNKADENPDYSKGSTTPAKKEEIIISQFPLNKQYYVDSASTTSETGDNEHPFHSLASAFTAIEKDVAQTASTQPVEVTISLKESSSVEVSDSVKLSLSNLDRPSSVIRLNTYSSDPSKITPEQATIQFKGPAAHLALSLEQTKLVVQDMRIQAEISEQLSNSELISVHVPFGEATFVKCDFSNIKADFKNSATPVINLNGGRYLIKSCSLNDLSLASPLFQVQDTDKGLIKFELNTIRSVTTTNCALVKALSLSSVDFVENKIQDTTGRLIQVETAKSVLFNNNTFSNIKGETPFDFSAVNTVVVGDNSFTYDSAKSEELSGLLAFANFGSLFMTRNTLKGYSGSVSPIKATVDESYASKSTATVKVIRSRFIENSLITKDADSEGLALLNMKLAKKIKVIIHDTVFDGNSIADKRTDTNEILDAAATIYIDAEDATVEIQNTVFASNKASRSLRNSYVNAKDITVKASNFTSNGQIKTGDSTQDSQGTFRSFLWFGESITFTQDRFKENYADQGGAIGIYQVDGQRVADHVMIEQCDFVQNEAKSGGAIFSNVDDERLSAIQQKDNTFTDNKADENPDYGTSSKISKNEDVHIYLEVISDNDKKTVYESDQYALEDIVSQEPMPVHLRFYVAEFKHSESEISGQYITSMQVDDEAKIIEGEEVVLDEAFIDKETGTSWALNTITLKAPAESNIAVKVVMAKKDNPSNVLTFSFSARMTKGVMKCDRGEFYLPSSKHCIKCPAGTYSFAVNAACLKCPIGADCSDGGDQVKVMPGFWRDVAEVDVLSIFKCPDDSHCVGGFNSGCEEGYTGALCNTCDTGENGTPRYRPFAPNTCKACDPITPAAILEDFIAISLPIVVLLYTVHALIYMHDGAETSKKRFSQCLYINLFVGYAQNLFILNTLGYIAMPSSIMTFVNIIANPSFATFGSLTCYFKAVDDGFMTILALFSAIPFIKGLVLLLSVKCLARSTNRVTAVSLIWLAFLEAPGFLDFVLRLFDCHQLGNNIHSRFSLGPQCNSENFEEVRLYVLLPLVILTAIASPLMVTYSLIKGSLRSDEHEEQTRLRTMLLAKSSEHIVKSERSWFYFCYTAFGRLGLLLLATSEGNTVAGLLAVALYYVSLTLMNKSRRVASFEGWRSSVLSVDALFTVINMTFGSLISMANLESRGHLVGALWIVNAVYVAGLYGVRLIGGDEVQYDRLQNQNQNKEVMSPKSDADLGDYEDSIAKSSNYEV